MAVTADQYVEKHTTAIRSGSAAEIAHVINDAPDAHAVRACWDVVCTRRPNAQPNVRPLLSPDAHAALAGAANAEA